MRLFIIVIFSLGLGACSQTPVLNESTRMANTPSDWQALAYNKSNTKLTNYWPEQYGSEEVSNYIQQAITNNYALQQLILDIEIQLKRLTLAQANLLPSLSLGFQKSRQQTSSAIGNNYSLELNGSYEIDLWGKLSAQEKSATYTYLSTLANVEQQTQQLVADVFVAYANALEAQQLLTLFSSLSQSSREGLSIIETGYKQGLNSALDVYLARNELNSDLAREAQQEASKIASVRSLETLVGKYPTGRFTLTGDIPSINAPLNIGIPSTMVM